MTFGRVLVAGAGQMGAGIAQVVAASGREVLLYDAFPGAVDRGLEAMRRSLTKLHEKGGAAPDEVLGRVTAVEGLVEVIRAEQTSNETATAIVTLARELGKTPAEANDYPGFVSNRILMPFINEAVYALMEGVAAPAPCRGPPRAS